MRFQDKDAAIQALWRHFRPEPRRKIARHTYAMARAFGRGRVVACWLALCMLLAGRTPRYRIR